MESYTVRLSVKSRIVPSPASMAMPSAELFCQLIAVVHLPTTSGHMKMTQTQESTFLSVQTTNHQTSLLWTWSWHMTAWSVTESMWARTTWYISKSVMQLHPASTLSSVSRTIVALSSSLRSLAVVPQKVNLKADDVSDQLMRIGLKSTSYWSMMYTFQILLDRTNLVYKNTVACGAALEKVMLLIVQDGFAYPSDHWL